MTRATKVDLETPTMVTALTAVPEVPTKSTDHDVAESGETYLEAILLIRIRLF